MEDQAGQARCHWKGTTAYVVTRSIIALVVIVAVLWALTHAVRRIEWPSYSPPLVVEQTPAPEVIDPQAPGDRPAALPEASPQVGWGVEEGQPFPAQPSGPMGPEGITMEAENKTAEELPSSQALAPAGQTAVVAPETKIPSDHAQPVVPTAPAKPTNNLLPTPGAQADAAATPAGVALVGAVMGPLAHELNDRSWGWRPNDLLNVTDNVNNFQLGVLEVTRRAIVQLALYSSNSGSAETADANLKNARDLIMTKATRHWFPSAESKYKESLEALKAYKRNLESGQAQFYPRVGDLIPFLATFEDLLESCDHDLVKDTETDGSAVSTFKADDYFYYVQGVAHAMAAILEGLQSDFAQIMEDRHSPELLQQAIEACQRAVQIDPWVVTDADLGGILANHRANMAAPIGQARYYLGQLVVALST